jgi:hypothetical protein
VIVVVSGLVSPVLQTTHFIIEVFSWNPGSQRSGSGS